jgi:hypothetical protein
MEIVLRPLSPFLIEFLNPEISDGEAEDSL